MPPCKARSTHISDGWNPKAKGLCKQAHFKGSSYLLKSLAPLLQIIIPLVTLMQLFVRLLSKQSANKGQLEQGLQNALKQILWSSFQYKPINNNSKTKWVEHCNPEHYFDFVEKNNIYCKITLWDTESILVAEGIREGRGRNTLNNYNFFLYTISMHGWSFQIKLLQ